MDLLSIPSRLRSLMPDAIIMQRTTWQLSVRDISLLHLLLCIFPPEGQPMQPWVVVGEVKGGVKRYTEMVRRLHECESRRTLCDLKNNHVYQCSPRTDQQHKGTITYIACTLCSE